MMRGLFGVAGLVGLMLVTARAQAWSSNPSVDDPVSSGIWKQTAPTAVADGTGGVIVAWEYFAGSDDIRAQRLDASGARTWNTSGVVVCDATGSQTEPVAVADGAGGAIIVWLDARTTQAKLYAQRVLPNGTFAWADDGVLVSGESGVFEAPVVASDGAGGVLVAARRTTAGVTHAQVQRLDAGGNRLWGTNGIAASGSGAGTPAVAAAGAGGAFVAWGDASGIVAQRLDANGAAQWGASGVAVSSQGAAISHVSVVPDGAGDVHVVWSRYLTFSGIVLGRKVSGAGAAQGSDVTLLTGSFSNTGPKTIPDGSGGVVMTWTRTLNAGRTLLAQRVDANGQAAWGNGVALDSLQDEHGVVRAQSGDFIAVWSLGYNANTPGLWAQSLASNGAKNWSGTGVLASSSAAAPVSVVAFGTGAVVAFDAVPPSGSERVLAKLVNADGSIGDEVDAGTDAGSGGADAGADASSDGSAGAAGSAGTAGAAGSAGAAGGSGNGGSAGAGGASASGGSGGSSGSGGGSGSGGSAAAGGSGGAGLPDAGPSSPGDDDGGCGCRAPGDRRAGDRGALAVLMGLLVLRRRRARAGRVI